MSSTGVVWMADIKVFGGIIKDKGNSRRLYVETWVCSSAWDSRSTTMALGSCAEFQFLPVLRATPWRQHLNVPGYQKTATVLGSVAAILLNIGWLSTAFGTSFQIHVLKSSWAFPSQLTLRVCDHHVVTTTAYCARYNWSAAWKAIFQDYQTKPRPWRLKVWVNI